MHTYIHIYVQEMAKIEVFKKTDVSPAAEREIGIHTHAYTHTYMCIYIYIYIYIYI